MDYKPGDKVKLHTVKEEIEGIILESHEPEIILVKLKSGYNIGIKKEDIHKIEVLGKKKEEKKKEMNRKSSNLPKIDIIMTGGTISSKLDSSTGGVKWLTEPEDFFETYPEIFNIVDVRKIKRPFMKASENMDHKDWQIIASEVEESLNNKEVEGVIVTHGTDFLHYTSAALSFFLKNLNKPVVLTYAQRSSDRSSSDARLNLQCAAQAAISDIAEVMLIGHATTNDDYCYALRGTKVRKLHASKRDAFKPVNTMPIAKVWPDKVESITLYNKRDNNKKVTLDNGFNNKIALIKFHPEMEPDIIDYYSQKYQGLIIEVSGLGHIASEESTKNLIPKIKKATDNGVVVCAVPQTIFGRLDPLVYSPGRRLAKTGMIFLQDMLAETAFVKLGWVLSHSNWKGKIKEKMLENFAGEINDRLEE